LKKTPGSRDEGRLGSKTNRLNIHISRSSETRKLGRDRENEGLCALDNKFLSGVCDATY